METAEAVEKYFQTNKNLPFKSRLVSANLLTGGLVNFVHRLRFEDGSTAVLKSYPPFIAFYRTISLSQNRYFVEKTALEALSSQPWLNKNPNSIIRTPKVLFSDDESFVLIMEDAGDKCETLFNLLASDVQLDDNFIELIPKEVKIFVNYLSKESGLTPNGNQIFVKVWQIVEEYFSQLWSNMTQKLQLEKEMELYLEKSKEIFKYKDSMNGVFVMGDLWPNSILIDQENKFIWIVDWEAARFETSTRDMEQLLANLWLMKQSPKFNKDKIESLIKHFQLEFFNSKDIDWRKGCGDFAKYNFILWIVGLLNESHWDLDNKRDTALKAFSEIADF
ncbi:hypothetical protein BpHYR1_021778 [Brachionus plicatilis]|uniref:Aminoglycoside phosphotransferase domain-containing protein n=1 Tax=Brachionus plicatilis TaxID=10195 RepID=A0A3M7P8C1_BRAPC|nr:hypothetical protein BpHYR1_021778 [Brachionus plicatilis]